MENDYVRSDPTYPPVDIKVQSDKIDEASRALGTSYIWEIGFTIMFKHGKDSNMSPRFKTIVFEVIAEDEKTASLRAEKDARRRLTLLGWEINAMSMTSARNINNQEGWSTS